MLCFRFQNPKEPPSYDAITKVAELETVEDSNIEEEVKEITPTAPPAPSGMISLFFIQFNLLNWNNNYSLPTAQLATISTVIDEVGPAPGIMN